MTSVTPAALPPIVQTTPVAWLKKNLFSTWYNVLITLTLVWLLGKTALDFFRWALQTAQWEVISANLPLYFVGQYPADQFWRLWLILEILVILAGLTWGVVSKNARTFFGSVPLVIAAVIAAIVVVTPTPLPYRLGLLGTELVLFTSGWIGYRMVQRTDRLFKVLSIAWPLSFVLILWLLIGGVGLKQVQSNMLGGLVLTVLAALVSSILAFPLGILLALGRQSSLPAVSWISTGFIEVIRGTPLTAILFVGAVMLPYFLPPDIRPDLVLRTIVGLTLFCMAYTAETIRGGLQAIPKGQFEAASALGLNRPLSLSLIVLPQAIKIVIPAMVGLFIQMVQETTLISIVGLSELFRISRSILSNPLFIGRYAEVYLFIGLLYWVICYSMSIGSRRLEERLRTSH
jgi:general L-amino acid transport system permease protein